MMQELLVVICALLRPRGLRRGSAALARWGYGFTSRRGDGRLSVVIDICSEEEVSASG